MRAEAITCDVCGRVKGAANHWFAATNAGVRGLHVYGAGTAMPSCATDLCGEECLHVWINANLASLKETNAE